MTKEELVDELRKERDREMDERITALEENFKKTILLHKDVLDSLARRNEKLTEAILFLLDQLDDPGHNYIGPQYRLHRELSE